MLIRGIILQNDAQPNFNTNYQLLLFFGLKDVFDLPPTPKMPWSTLGGLQVFAQK